ncbi:hypothetical protein JW992_04940 [candidate division KSB1 bacterium]|nr:hypothetical protein [candidate division KSB1 bacterium]
MPLVDLDSLLTIPRIGEILVVGPSNSANLAFIEALCPNIEKGNSDFIWGQMQASSDLELFFYGLCPAVSYREFAWDLVAPKLLGIVVLFDWYETQAKDIQDLVDFLIHKTAAPIICAADACHKPLPFREAVYRPPIALSRRCKFTFCQSSRATFVRRTVISLLDMLLNELG